MARYRPIKAERETILTTTEADAVWYVTTANTSLKKRLRAFAALHPDLCQLQDEDEETGSVSYTIAKSRLSIHLNPPQSEDRRKAASAYAKLHGIHTKPVPKRQPEQSL